MSNNNTLNVLRIDASARYDASASRQLTDAAIESLRTRYSDVNVVERDLGRGTSFIDETWVGATFTPEAERTPAQRTALAGSDTLVAELEAADLVIVGTPMYNFGVPAALKAWMDLVARAGRTFRYTEAGPEGLLKNKQAWIAVTSGGVPLNAPVDFATPHLVQFLNFLGFDAVETIDGGRLNADAEAVMDAARARIANLALTGDAIGGDALAKAS
ncbi:MAG: NAD(P)H-dependent oxidoreductase [Pseudomonadota bacterium]